MSGSLPYGSVASGAHQVCFVTDDISGTEDFLSNALGVGRFCRFDDISFDDLTYRGRPADFRLDLSLAYAGEMQVEVIAPLSGPSLYTEFLEKRGPGLHHLGFIVEDIEAAIADFGQRGFPVAQSGRFGKGAAFAYFDTEAACGAIMEVFQLDEAARGLFDRIRRGDF